VRTEEQIIQFLQTRHSGGGRAGGGRFGNRMAVGIGDDAAVFRASRGSDWVVSTDQFIEGQHFIADCHPPEVVGYKSLARAASDLAAMGAAPFCYLLNLALPRSRTGAWLDGFARGLARASRQFGLRLAGGDTSHGKTIGIGITVVGSAAHGTALTRSGARVGELLYVTGTLGHAALGLELVLRGVHGSRGAMPLLQRHYFPEPRLAVGEWLAARRLPTAMIDISDGFAKDLHRLCAASKVGAVVWEGKLPQFGIPAAWSRLRLKSLELALHGGEDYELLFTVPWRRRTRIPSRIAGVPVHCIGLVRSEGRIQLEGFTGRTRPLSARGWEHFRSGRS